MNRQLATVSVLLGICCALLLEEGVYLKRHPFSMVVGESLEERFRHCHPVRTDGDYATAYCDLYGFNQGLFLCKKRFCIVKEPANGTAITPLERRWIDHQTAVFLEQSSPEKAAGSGLEKGGPEKDGLQR